MSIYDLLLGIVFKWLCFDLLKGALVSVCADDQLHLWSLRQKNPEIVHSLKFQRER